VYSINKIASIKSRELARTKQQLVVEHKNLKEEINRELVDETISTKRNSTKKVEFEEST